MSNCTPPFFTMINQILPNEILYDYFKSDYVYITQSTLYNTCNAIHTQINHFDSQQPYIMESKADGITLPVFASTHVPNATIIMDTKRATFRKLKYDYTNNK